MRTRVKSAVAASLKIIGAAGFAGVVIAAPNGAQALGKLLIKALDRLDEPETRRVMRILKRQGLVQLDKTGNGYKITITPAGAYRLQAELLDDIIIPPMAKWDGHWRLVCYDIPAGKNKERYTLTYHLHRMGFTMIQKSMWVHPHKCIEQIEQLADALLLSKWVTVIEVTQLDTRTTQKLVDRYQHTIRI